MDMKDIKKKILELHKKGIKRKEISEKLNFEYSTVTLIVKNEQARLRRLKNLSKARKQARDRYRNNPGPTLAYQEERYKKKRKKIIKAVSAYTKKNKRKVYMRHNKAARKKREELKEEVFAQYSHGKPRCVCCGISGIEFLNMDHIKGRKIMERDKKLKKLGYSQKLKADHLIVWLEKNMTPIRNYLRPGPLSLISVLRGG